MKTTSLRTALSLIILIFELVSTPYYVSGQTSSTDLRINEVPDLDPHFDGTQTLAVRGANIYAVFTDTVFGGTSDLFLARSLDGGLTVEPNVSIFSNTEIISMWPSVAVGNDGTIHVAWTAVTPLPEGSTENVALRGGGLEGNFNIWYSSSTDNGQTFSQPTIITTSNGSVFPLAFTTTTYT